MTMPDVDPPRKPRPRRWGLFAPYIALAAAAVAWSGYWVAARAQLDHRLVQEAAALRASGYEARWSGLKIGGYPFRLEVEVSDPRIMEPGGWGLAAPRLEAVANAYDLGHWVFNAPAGLILTRPGAGRLVLSGQALRASIANLSKAPRFAFEGEGVTFAPPPGAGGFPLTSAARIDIRLRAAPDDRTQLEWRLKGAQLRRAGALARIAPLAPLSLTLTAELSHASALSGGDWAASVRRWGEAGGTATVSQVAVSAGNVGLSGEGGPITVGADGRLRGGLDLALRQGAAVLDALASAQAMDPDAAHAAAEVSGARPDGRLRLSFEAGVTTLGPVRIGPAPRIY